MKEVKKTSEESTEVLESSMDSTEVNRASQKGTETSQDSDGGKEVKMTSEESTEVIESGMNSTVVNRASQKGTETSQDSDEGIEANKIGKESTEASKIGEETNVAKEEIEEQGQINTPTTSTGVRESGEIKNCANTDMIKNYVDKGSLSQPSKWEEHSARVNAKRRQLYKLTPMQKRLSNQQYYYS